MVYSATLTIYSPTLTVSAKGMEYHRNTSIGVLFKTESRKEIYFTAGNLKSGFYIERNLGKKKKYGLRFFSRPNFFSLTTGPRKVLQMTCLGGISLFIMKKQRKIVKKPKKS